MWTNNYYAFLTAIFWHVNKLGGKTVLWGSCETYVATLVDPSFDPFRSLHSSAAVLVNLHKSEIEGCLIASHTFLLKISNLLPKLENINVSRKLILGKRIWKFGLNHHSSRKIPSVSVCPTVVGLFVAYEEKEPYVDNLYDFKLTFAHTLKGCSFPQTPPSHRGCGCSAALTVRAQQVLGEFFFRAKNGDELMMIMTML